MTDGDASGGRDEVIKSVRFSCHPRAKHERASPNLLGKLANQFVQFLGCRCGPQAIEEILIQCHS